MPGFFVGFPTQQQLMLHSAVAKVSLPGAILRTTADTCLLLQQTRVGGWNEQGLPYLFDQENYRLKNSLEGKRRQGPEIPYATTATDAHAECPLWFNAPPPPVPVELKFSMTSNRLPASHR